MKRRSFLQGLLALLPVAAAKGALANTAVAPSTAGYPVAHRLTISDFGADATVCKTPIAALEASGLSWHHSAQNFPQFACTGDVFLFNPTHHKGLLLSDFDRKHLTACYVFDGTRWLAFGHTYES